VLWITVCAGMTLLVLTDPHESRMNRNRFRITLNRTRSAPTVAVVLSGRARIPLL
jgi:hypothetical protein